MNTSRIFWGTLWIVAGVLILLAKLDILTLQVGSLWKFWPVVIVLWGVSILVGAKPVRALLAVVAAILLALILYGAWEEWGPGGESRQLTTQTFIEKYDTSYHRASVRFVSGAGSFTIGDTCADLLRAETVTNFGSYEISGETGTGEKNITLRMADHMRGFRTGGKNTVSMRLNPGPVWSFTVELGAATLDADFTPYAAERIDIKTGAADVRLKLGDRSEESHVKIQAGASSIVVRVPASAGCEIRSESGLSSKTFEGFEVKGDGMYRTGNLDTAARKIFLDFKGGVSSLKVVRY